ncbi:MAG: hypothetical protein K9L28_00095 [Synergistales bacterium]|nr:hypothetical protein [Synergistales bacterium]
MRSSILEQAIPLLEHLEARGARSALVGGTVRDLLLGIEPHDIDIVTEAHDETLPQLLPQAKPVGQRCARSWLLPGTDRSAQITSSNGTTLERERQRRDLTVNAIAMFSDGTFLADPQCWEDMAQRTLRFHGNPAQRLGEDPLRAVRFFRFLHTLPGFGADACSRQHCSSLRNRLGTIAGERLGLELLRAVDGHFASWCRDLQTAGLLTPLFTAGGTSPGIKPSGQSTSFSVLESICACHDSRKLRLAALFLDRGEPWATQQCVRSVAERAGASLAALCIGRDLLEGTRELIAWHRLPGGTVSPRRLQILLSAKGADWLEELFLLSWCVRSAADTSRRQWMANRRHLVRLLLRAKQVLPLGVTGEDVKGELQISGGPAVGRVLRTLERLALEGAISTREDALRWLRSRKGRVSPDSPGRRRKEPSQR